MSERSQFTLETYYGLKESLRDNAHPGFAELSQNIHLSSIINGGVKFNIVNERVELYAGEKFIGYLGAPEKLTSESFEESIPEQPEEEVHPSCFPSPELISVGIYITKTIRDEREGFKPDTSADQYLQSFGGYLYY